VINGILALEETPLLTENDQVELYPPMGGGNDHYPDSWAG